MTRAENPQETQLPLRLESAHLRARDVVRG